MKKIVVLIIIPDIKAEEDKLKWEKNVEWASENYTTYPYIKDIDTEKRWAIGFVMWNKIIDLLQTLNVYTIFIRCDSTLKNCHEIKDNILSIKFNNSYGHIIFKTLYAFKLYENQYDLYVRGNTNTLIDLNQLSAFANSLNNNTEVFISPFWEGGSYPYGYFMMFSKDVINFILQNTIAYTESLNYRWFKEDTADDYELTEVTIRKCRQMAIPGCDVPWYSVYLQARPERKKINDYGIIFEDEEDSSVAINKISKLKDTVFLYRLRNLSDKNYFEVYKAIQDDMWDKVIKQTFPMTIYNECNFLVPHLEYERPEQLLVSRYVEPNDVVLELGARYGSVSCIINKILNKKTNQVSVEPESTVWNVLERNKLLNNCDFHIFKGIISQKKYQLKLLGYGSTIDLTNTLQHLESADVENLSLSEIEAHFSLKFNVLVADCEGFLEVFLNENPQLYEQLEKIFFECDRADVCNYEKIKSNLKLKGFKAIENGFQCFFRKE